jgi:hypothetical protein
MRRQLLGFLAFAFGATSAAAEQQFVQTCEKDYCFQGFIEKVSPAGSGLFKVKAKYVGLDGATKQKTVERKSFTVSCDRNDAYVATGRERIDVNRTDGSLRGAHVTQEADQLWKAVCAGR